LVQLHEFGEIELWLLEDLGLSDHAVVLEWVDLAALFLDLFTNLFFNKDLCELLEGRFLDCCLHNLHHLLSDELLVGSLGEAGCLDLSLGSLGEGNCEQSKDVPIGGLGLNEGLDKGVPFLDHGAGLVSGNVHTVEVSIAVESLDLVNLELKLSPGDWLRLVVAISKGDAENTTSQTVSGVLLTGGLVARGQSDTSFVVSWGKDVIPLFLGEWVSAKTK